MRLSLPSFSRFPPLTYLPPLQAQPSPRIVLRCTTIAVVKSRIAVRVGIQQLRPVMIDVVVSAELGYFDLSGTKPLFFTCGEIDST